MRLVRFRSIIADFFQLQLVRYQYKHDVKPEMQDFRNGSIPVLKRFLI